MCHCRQPITACLPHARIVLVVVGMHLWPVQGEWIVILLSCFEFTPVLCLKPIGDELALISLLIPYVALNVII